MESCARVIGMFQDYVEGELPPGDRGRVAGHLEGCEFCRKRVHADRCLFQVLDRLPQIVPPAHFRSSVMTRVLSSPLPVSSKRGRHLRLVRALFWVTLAAATGSAGGAGAFLLAQNAWTRTGVLDPALFADWVGALGRVAFSFLLDMATRSQIPTFLPSPRTPLGWGGITATLLFLGCAAGVAGVGILATARALLGPTRRRPGIQP